MSGAWRETAAGLELRVRLTPKGGADRIDGLRTGSDGIEYLAVRVRAVPEKGKANAALARLLSRGLDVPAGMITLTTGATARMKTLRIEGDGARLLSALRALAVRTG